MPRAASMRPRASLLPPRSEEDRMAAPDVSVSRRIAAPPGRVYAAIADYRDGHARITPRPPFGDLVVEEGGMGEGTVIRVGIRLMGTERTFRARVTEPEPGRVLVETDLATGTATTFTVRPDDGGTRVTIATVLQPTRSGFLGMIERVVSARFLRPVYLQELALLAGLVEG